MPRQNYAPCLEGRKDRLLWWRSMELEASNFNLRPFLPETGWWIISETIWKHEKQKCFSTDRRAKKRKFGEKIRVHNCILSWPGSKTLEGSMKTRKSRLARNMKQVRWPRSRQIWCGSQAKVLWMTLVPYLGIPTDNSTLCSTSILVERESRGQSKWAVLNRTKRVK